jgi:hypothetical protein
MPGFGDLGIAKFTAEQLDAARKYMGLRTEKLTAEQKAEEAKKVDPGYANNPFNQPGKGGEKTRKPKQKRKTTRRRKTKST